MFLMFLANFSKTTLITDLQSFEDGLSRHTDGHAQVKDAEDDVEAHEHARTCVVRDNIAKADCFDGDNGEVQSINEVEVDQEGVDKGPKGDVHQEKHDDDQERALFATHSAAL